MAWKSIYTLQLPNRHGTSYEVFEDVADEWDIEDLEGGEFSIDDILATDREGEAAYRGPEEAYKINRDGELYMVIYKDQNNNWRDARKDNVPLLNMKAGTDYFFGHWTASGTIAADVINFINNNYRSKFNGDYPQRPPVVSPEAG